jgi:hypothetical protein
MPVIIREYDGAKFTVSKEGDVRCAGDLVFDSIDRLMSDDWTEWVIRIAKGLKREWLALKEREGNWVDKYGRKVECSPQGWTSSMSAVDLLATIEKAELAKYWANHWRDFDKLGSKAKPSKWHENCVPIPKGKQVIVRNRIKEYAIMTVCPIGCQWAEIPE